MSPRPHGRQQINHERKHISRKDKRNNPLQDSADILLLARLGIHADAEADCEADFDYYKGEFDDETCEQDSVLAAVEYSDPEVFGAD
jgi:hypothetical protein